MRLDHVAMMDLLEQAAIHARRARVDRAAFLDAAGKEYDERMGFDALTAEYFRLHETNALPPDTALVISGPLYDARGNLRPQTLITGIGSAETPSAGGEE